MRSVCRERFGRARAAARPPHSLPISSCTLQASVASCRLLRSEAPPAHAAHARPALWAMVAAGAVGSALHRLLHSPRIRMRHTTAPSSPPPLTAPLYTACRAMQRAVQCRSTCFAAGATLQPAQLHHYPPTISPALQSVTWTCGRAASGCGAVMWPRGQLWRSSHGAHLLQQQRHA